MLTALIPNYPRRWPETTRLLTALGPMYFVRGLFMFFFPIGAPQGALDASQRPSVWGHESHADFPGGHIAILTILTMFTRGQKIRWILWIGVIIFWIGTLLSKNHYTMDSVAGIIIVYAVSLWVMRHMPDRISRGAK